MRLVRKLIILKALTGGGKGIVKLDSFGTRNKGLINISEPKGRFRLGIRVGYSRLYEYELDGLNYEFDLGEGLDLSDRIECLLINSDNSEPVLYGSSDGKSVNINSLKEMFTKDNPVIQETMKEAAENKADENRDNIKIETKLPEADDNIINDNKENAPDSPAIEVMYIETDKDVNQANIIDNKELNQENAPENVAAAKPPTKEPDEDFFNSIKPQIDELFRCYPADKDLMKSVPDSKWVRVNYENDDYYVVGILFNGSRATHICYGVPGEYSIKPKQKSEWLPLDYMDPEGKGYWMIFQDAVTGKTIE
ncbi:MAG: hypothetical protein ACOX3U_07955 [Christensenellales bacterium]|jgi:hypothetical protein